jgi:hypothetical protein
MDFSHVTKAKGWGFLSLLVVVKARCCSNAFEKSQAEDEADRGPHKTKSVVGERQSMTK